MKKPTGYQNIILHGLNVRVISILIWANILLVALSETVDPRKLRQFIKGLITEKKFIYGHHQINKIVKSQFGFQFSLNIPPWPSKAFNQYFRFTIQRMLSPQNLAPDAARMLLFAITKKCPLNCEHCYEWEEINHKEMLSDEEVHQIVSNYQNIGTSVIWLGGGEPLSRFSTLYSVLRQSKKSSSFWLSTSGYNLTAKKAMELKEAGLTGIIVSLDHFEKEKHNAFRGNPASFDYVQEAVKNGLEAGLVVGLSLCTIREACTSVFIHDYMHLARDWGAGFVQCVEPGAAGRYAGKDVELADSDYQVLDQLYEAFSFDKKYSDLPLISHPGYAQRRIGCGAAGVYNVFVDTNGKRHACPFCRLKGHKELPSEMTCEKFSDRIFFND